MLKLPELPAIAVLSPYVTRVLGLNPGSFCLQGTNTYLVGRPGQNKRLLIDTGVGKPGYIPLLTKYLETVGLELVGILVTHWHEDHVGGVLELKESFPNVVVYKFECGRHDWKGIYTYINDNDVVELAGVKLTALYTPGHSEDHLCFWLEEEQVLFSGDHILGHGTVIFMSYISYMESLYRVKAIPGLNRIYPAHGQVVENGPGMVTDYIFHRQERENEVLELVRASNKALTVDEVAQQMYKHVADPHVLKAAGRMLGQVLEKLENDGVVLNPDREGDTWIARSDSPSRL